jgi:hypothetical protein
MGGVGLGVLPGCVSLAGGIVFLGLCAGLEVLRGILCGLSGEALPAVRVVENAIPFLEGFSGLCADAVKLGVSPIRVFRVGAIHGIMGYC